MTGEIEAVGDIATGSVVASTVEGLGPGGESREGACLNCGATLTGPFCGQCGQKARVHRTLGAFGHDLLHSILHFDGNIWRTLPLLLFKPGALTRRYIHGERAKFISPLALFLFSMFFMFAVFNAFAPKLDEANSSKFGQAVALAQQQSDAETRVEALKERIAKGEQTPGLQGQLEGAEAALEGINQSIERLTNAPGRVAGSAKSNPVFSSDTGIAWLDNAAKEATKNPQLLLYKAQSGAYKFSWALIILSVPFVWMLFFWRREYKVYDHAVFVTYSLCFVSLLLTVAALIGHFTTAGETISGLAMLWIPLHMYLQLRGAYQISRGSALARAAVLTLVATLVSSLFVTLLLLNGML